MIRKLCLLFLIGISFLLLSAYHKSEGPRDNRGKTYYVHSTIGDDSNSGTSRRKPVKSLSRVNELDIDPGDRILLACGQVYNGTIIFDQVSGEPGRRIFVSSYVTKRSSETPVIDAYGKEAAIVLRNCSHIEVSGLMVTAKDKVSSMVEDQAGDKRCGILVEVDGNGTYSDIVLRQLVVKDIFFEDPGFSRSLEETRSANGTQSYGWGIRVINTSKQAVLRDLTIDSCKVNNVGHTGIKLTAKFPGKGEYGIQNFRITGNQVESTGGPGIQMSGVKNGYIANNTVRNSGSTDDSRKWGRGSGLWTWSSRDILIERNSFLNANGPGDSAGAHIDFNCSNVVLQYNFSANNAGGFCEILGNNHNCAYRYNISVNDGHRVKGENNAFQEGKTFWLSGYQGKNRKRHGPFNSYFYNNTIIVGKDIVAKFAIDKAASGILIANNIFHIEGATEWVLGDQYRPEKKGAANMKHIVFSNNLYLDRYSWPGEAPVHDSKPFIGDAGLIDLIDLDLEKYIPKNRSMIEDAGIELYPLPGDTVGLTLGLKVQKDILGNPVIHGPDLGAIELSRDLP